MIRTVILRTPLTRCAKSLARVDADTLWPRRNRISITLGQGKNPACVDAPGPATKQHNVLEPAKHVARCIRGTWSHASVTRSALAGPVAEVVEIRGGVISGLCNEPDSAVRRRCALVHECPNTDRHSPDKRRIEQANAGLAILVLER